MKKTMLSSLAVGTMILFLVFAFSCTSVKKDSQTLSVEYEQFQLDNGLDVILAVDKSDPIVSLAIQYHVGSNREVKGRTGFAHLFEHMMFQESENVGQDQFFKKIQNAGGMLNGGTSNDGTIYFEVVPKNALELALWLESDRMGYMINMVTQSAFVNQQNVVQNEKRQTMDNQPYGYTRYVIGKNLYPEGHPYSWTVIGEMEDLFNATVEDVKEFHSKYYVPNNATLALVGDFDPAEARELIQKYFGEIPEGEEVNDPQPWPVKLEATKKLYHEDNFARTAQLRMVWPTVENYHPDSYPLQFFSELISSGKKAPLYKILVKEKQLTSRSSAYNSSLELAGTFNVNISANSGVSLQDIHEAIFESFHMFEEEGISENDLERIKAGLETSYYNSISSVFMKSYMLANFNEYTGDPSFIEKNIELIRAVSIEDIQRVYNEYIKDKPYLVTSFVPRGQLDLMVENSVKADIVEESIADATEVSQDVADAEELVRTETILDRSVEPVPGPDPEITIPEIWKDKLANGMKVYGILHDELPLVQYNIVLEGGHLFDDIDKVGVANLVGALMMEGTKNKTPLELEEEIELLGANISIRTGNQSIYLNVNSLARNFEKTLALAEEILLEPRWDEEEFELAKIRIINSIKQQEARPNYIANNAFNKLLYKKDHLLAYNTSGTVESVESIQLQDLKDYYEKYFSPSVAKFHIVGSVSREQVMTALSALNNSWLAKEVDLPKIEVPQEQEASRIYFVDLPGAKQSVIQIGYLALPRTDPDYYPATVMNYKLGGSFSGVLNLILREEKGFTYGARSGFYGTDIIGPFEASSSVRSNTTLESIQIFKETMEAYREGISQEDLDFTKNALLKSNARRFETLRSLLGMLRQISAYDLPDDYIKQEEEIVRNMTLETHKALAEKYIVPDKMYFVIVGDAESQLKQLSKLGFGEPVLIKD